MLVSGSAEQWGTTLTSCGMMKNIGLVRTLRFVFTVQRWKLSVSGSVCVKLVEFTVLYLRWLLVLEQGLSDCLLDCGLVHIAQLSVLLELLQNGLSLLKESVKIKRNNLPYPWCLVQAAWLFPLLDGLGWFRGCYWQAASTLSSFLARMGNSKEWDLPFAQIRQ